MPGADEVRSKVAVTSECHSDVTIFYTYDTDVGPANLPTAFTLGHEMPDGWKHSVRRIHAAKIDNYCTGVLGNRQRLDMVVEKFQNMTHFFRVYAMPDATIGFLDKLDTWAQPSTGLFDSIRRYDRVCWVVTPK